MNLQELKECVDGAIETAIENGESPAEIVVTLQIDGPEAESVWSSDEVELHYDGNIQASGCVLVAFREAV